MARRTPAGSWLEPIVTPRLLLRELAATDVAALGALIADPRVREYAPLETRALEAARRDGRPGRAPRRHWELGVVVRRTGRLIGACDLALTGPGVADFGYMLARRHWGHGYGTELVQALLATGFLTLRLRRLSAVVAIENERSRRVLEKAGLRWEGLLRRHVRAGGRSWDCHRYALGRRDWADAQALRGTSRRTIMTAEDP